jgi:hypothetical protein
MGGTCKWYGLAIALTYGYEYYLPMCLPARIWCSIRSDPLFLAVVLFWSLLPSQTAIMPDPFTALLVFLIFVEQVYVRQYSIAWSSSLFKGDDNLLCMYI